MKIIARIPTEKIQGTGWHTFTCQSFEVDVIRVLRLKACSTELKRYHYQADIVPPPEFHKDYPTYPRSRVTIDRKINKKWKPPIFEDGSNVFEVKNIK